MPTSILDKFGTSTAFTITLNSLANFTGTNGRQSTMIDNSSAKAHAALIHVKVTNNAAVAPTANSTIDVYLIRANKHSSPDVIDDTAGASDATWPGDSSAGINAEFLGSLVNGSGGTSDVLQKTFLAEYLGPSWGIAVINRSGQALHSSGNAAYYETVDAEIQ